MTPTKWRLLVAAALMSIAAVTNAIAGAPRGVVDRGVEAPAISKGAPEQTVHWGRLVGNWNFVLEELTPDGRVAESYAGEWNFFYTLGGAAIQDVFILPPRSAEMSPEDHFYGTGIRIFDDETKMWRVVWIDTSGRQFEIRQATSSEDKIVMTSGPGANKKRWIYYNFYNDRFQWRQEVMVGGEWVIDQRLMARRQ